MSEYCCFTSLRAKRSSAKIGIRFPVPFARHEMCKIRIGHMKITQSWIHVAGLCSLVAALPVHGALIGLTKDVSSPSFADFTLNGLDVKSTYNAGTGIASF